MFLVLVSKCQHAAFLNAVYHGEPVMLHLLNISMLSCYHADVSIWINAHCSYAPPYRDARLLAH